MLRHTAHRTDSTRKDNFSQQHRRQLRAQTRHAAGLVAEALEQRMLLSLPTAAQATAWAPFAPGLPAGSLVSQSVATGTLPSPSDAAALPLRLQAGQQLSLLLQPSSTLRPELAVLDPAGTCLASRISPVTGQGVWVQTLPVPTSGTYQILLRPASGSGDYTLQASLNAARETETLTRLANNNPATAQDLDGSFLSLGANAQRAAVLGSGDNPGPLLLQADFSLDAQGFTVDNSGGGLWHLSIGHGSESGHSASQSFYYGQNETASGGGSYNTGTRNSGSLLSPSLQLPQGQSISLSFNHLLRTESSSSYDVAQLQINAGSGWSTLASYNRTAESSTWKATSVDLSGYAGRSVQLRWFFDTKDAMSNSFEGWYVDDVKLQCAASSLDYYSFTLQAGETASIVLKKLASGTAHVAITDAAGTVLVQGLATSGNVDELLSGFAAPSPGRYYVRLSSDAGLAYQLMVLRNTVFDSESNNTVNSAQNLSGCLTALGNVSGSDSDYYSVRLTAGERIRITTRTPGDGAGELANGLDPMLELYDAYGSKVASNDNGAADGRNASLVYQASQGGTFSVRVGAANGSSGEYVLQLESLPPGTATPTTPDLQSESDTGASSSDNVTRLNSGLRFLIGNTVTGATVSLWADGQLVGSAVADASSTLIASTATASWADGVHQFTATQQVPGQEASSPSVTLAVTIDTAAPAAPGAPVLQAGSDTGISISDRITQDTTPSFRIPTSPYYRVYRNGTKVSGEYESSSTYTAPVQPEGSWDYAITAVDAAGNESPVGPAITLTIDTTAPAQPGALDLQAAYDSGASSSDNLTNQTTLGFDVSAGGYYRVYRNGNLVSGSYQTGSTCQISSNPDGVHSFTVAAVDVAGNVSVPSSPLQVTVDTVAARPAMPDLQASSDSGISNSDNLTNLSNMVLQLAASEAGILHISVDGAGTTTDLRINAAGIVSLPLILQQPGFVQKTAFLVGSLWDLKIADFNRDGRADLLIGDFGKGLFLALGKGDGTFGSLQRIADSEACASIGDFNEDGKLDIALFSVNPPRLLINNGDGTFQSRSALPYSYYCGELFVADFNADGHADLLTVEHINDTYTILLGKGDGNFQMGKTVAFGCCPRSIQLGDVNGDGAVDVFYCPFNVQELRTCLGNKDGTLQASVTSPLPPYPYDLGTGDFNEDGRIDVIETSSSATVVLGQDYGYFATGPESKFTFNPAGLVVGDFDGDGHLDIASGSGTDTNIYWLRGKGDGTFRPVNLVSAGYNVSRMYTADVNGDGTLDWVTYSHTSQEMRVLLNSMTGAADGPHTVMAWFEDLAGNKSQVSDSLSLTLDTTTPNAPTLLDLQAASDTGSSNSDNYTDDHTPTFDVQAGPYYRVYRDGVQISRDYESGSTYTTPEQADGSYTYSIRSVDAAGNVSKEELKLQVTIGSILINAPDLLFTSDTGVSFEDDLTKLNNSSLDTALRLRVAPVVPGALVKLYADGTLIGSSQAASAEAVIVTDGKTPLADGKHAITWRTTLPGQAEGPDSPALTLTIDTQSPSTPPMLDLADFSDSGVSNTDHITNDNTPTLIAAGSEYFRFYCDGWQVSSDYEKSHFDPQPLSDGIHVIRVAAIDATGNFSALSPALSLTIDTVAPNAPGAISLDPASDTGRSNSDRITKDNTPTFNISLEDTAYYRLFVDGERSGIDYQTDAQYTLPLQPDGKHNYALRAVDIAGNVSAASADVYVTIDTVAPGIPAIPDLDASSDSGISDTDDITNRLAVAFNLDAREAGTLHLDIDGLASDALLNTDQAGSCLLSVPLLRMDFVAKDDALISKAGNLLADLDADGFPDCLYAAPREGLFVAIGKGDGSFYPYQRLPIQVDSTFYSCLAVNDFNEDGKPDIAIADHNIRVFLAKGDGTYQLGQSIPGDLVYLHFVVTDFNADGHADLMTTDYFSDAPFFKIMLGDGDGTFRPAQSLITGDRPAAVRVADLNGDGAADLIYSRPGIWSPSGWTDPKLAVHFGKGDGTFQSAIETSLEWPTDYLDVGDFNEDGKLDVLAIELCDAVLHLGHGDGTFTVAGKAQVAVEHSGMAVGDFDGDGHLDMAMGTGFNNISSDDEIWVLRGQGDGTLLPAIRYPTLSSPASVLAADLNGDGRLDLLSSDGRPLLNNSTILSKGSHRVTAWLEDVAGNASQPSQPMSFTFDTTCPSADIVDIAPDPHSGGIDSMTFTFDEAVVGFDLTDLSLCRDGGPNLLTAAQILTTSDSRTWLLTNLASLTGTPGEYTLHLNANSSSIVDHVGNALKTPVSEAFTVINAPPVLDRLSSQTVEEGRELTFTAVAKDANLPAQKLTFSIDSGAPAGVSIDPDTGVFRWTPSGTQNGVFYVTIRATDNGTPPLSDSKTVSIAVINVAPTVTVGPDVTVELGQTFAATGSFTDLGNDLCTATVDYGEGGSPQPLALTGNNFTLSHTYKSLGQHAVVVRVTDPEGGSSSDQLIVQVNTSRLIAVSVGSNGSGFDVQFNRPINTSKLNLYDGVDATTDLPDLTFVGQNSGPVAGSLFWEAESNTLHFVKTGGVLPSDMYMITLFSRADGFVDDAGELLDGDNNGIAGGDFRSSFGLCSTLTPAITIPPFARGPGQSVSVPAAESGLPIQIDNAEGLRSADLTLRFNPALLTITDVILAADMPDDWHVSTGQSTPGQLLVNLAGSTPLGRGSRALVKLKASVPRSAPYGESQTIELLGTVTTANGELIGVPRVASVQLVAYVGDASGNKTYSGVDAACIANVAIGAVSGFDAFPLIDPVIIGDVSGNGSIGGLDASYVAQKSVGMIVGQIPDLPAATPVASLAATAFATNSGTRPISMPLVQIPLLPRIQRPASFVPWGRKMSEGLFSCRAIGSEILN
ncbi:MAG: Ig-like domain-containing protein [Bacillota bacterium]